MSSIQRLQIQGIRSFGPDDKDKQVIKFHEHLTLILGQNGCGKTTIIEALKYATCGELPAGSDSGSGFVHDPKLSGRVDTYGQVKLKCKNTKNSVVTLSRTMQVTQKLKKLEFKSKDATVTDSNGKSISGRCVDIDTFMCDSLGVSKAVLINVIFCHQEDASWPLEKGKKMKERFDSIFGITEYNKCLDHIIKLAKELNLERELLRKEVECNSKFWEEAQDKQKKLEDTRSKLTAAVDCVEKYDRDLEPIEAKFDELLRMEAEFGKYVSELNTKKSHKGLLQTARRELKDSIQTEFHGSKAELLAKIESFQRDLKDKEKSIHKLKEDKEITSKEETRLQKSISVLQMQMGILQRDSEENEKKIESRNFNLNDLADELQVPGKSSSALSENEGYESLMRVIEEKIMETGKELERFRKQQEETEESLQTKINSLRDKKTSLEHDIKTKQANINNNDKDIRKVKADIEEIDRSAQILSKLQNDLEMVTRELDELEKSLDVNAVKNSISCNKAKVSNFEENLTALDVEIKSLQRVAVDVANLQKLEHNKRNRECEMEKLLKKNESTFISLLGSIPESGFKRKLDECITKLTNEIKSKEKILNTKQNSLTVLKERKRHKEMTLRTEEANFDRDEDRIRAICTDGDLSKFINNLNQRVQEIQDVKSTITSSEVLFRRYINKIEVQNKCPLCRRDFEDAEQVQDVVTELNGRLAEMPVRLQETIRELESLKTQHAKALHLQPTFENISKKRDTEIPKLKNEVNAIKAEISNLESEINTIKDELLSPQSDEALGKTVLSDAMLIDQHQNEMRSLEKEIAAVKSKIPQSENLRSLEEANDERDKIKKELMSIRKKMEDDQNKLTRFNEKSNKLREQENKLRSQQLKIEGGVQQRKSFTDRLENLEALQGALEIEFAEAKEFLSPVSKELDEAVQKLKQIKVDYQKLLAEKQKKLNQYDRKTEEIKKLQRGIKEYEEKGGKEKLISTKEKLCDLQLEKNELVDKQKKLEKEIEMSTQFLNTQQMKKLDLDNNLKFKIKSEEIEKVQEEIIALEGSAGDLDVNSLRIEQKKLKKQIETITNQKSHAEGRQLELQNNIQDILRELNKEQYKTAEEKYRKTYISLRVKTLAIEDLKQYEKAMDYAMIYFHKERMKMINTIVRDLWRQIYSGNDIDTIEIKMDETAPNASGRKNYNYRVVQIKSGTELDMPGRCSAGQKVLACLIIRIALAETFSKNCGILALDEPTTNLDRENIESLSNALAEIVTRRKAQNNFQLLVITHDEEFLKKLIRVEYVDYYLKVQRNSRGKSEVIQMKV